MERLPKRYLSVAETAKYICIAPKTLYNRLAPDAKKPFPVKPKRVGGRLIFDKKVLDEYMADVDTQG